MSIMTLTRKNCLTPGFFYFRFRWGNKHAKNKQNTIKQIIHFIHFSFLKKLVLKSFEKFLCSLQFEGKVL